MTKKEAISEFKVRYEPGKYERDVEALSAENALVCAAAKAGRS